MSSFGLLQQNFVADLFGSHEDIGYVVDLVDVFVLQCTILQDRRAVPALRSGKRWPGRCYWKNVSPCEAAVEGAVGGERQLEA